MLAAETQLILLVETAPDKRSAELIVPPGAKRDALCAESAFDALHDARIDITDAVREAVEQLLAERPAGNISCRGVVAMGTPARNGIDGDVIWHVSKPEDNEDADRTNYYERSSFIVVERDQVIGQLRAPTAGQPGRDVTGEPIPAAAGSAAKIALEAIRQEQDGRLIAEITGVLDRKPGAAVVRPVVDVPGNVDFSTGNIDFPGDVLVHGGVCDHFVVKATGNVEVNGTIEAATTECGGDLTAHGGMAGRGEGSVSVGGTLVGKYLDLVKGEVGCLDIAREVANCELVVHGDARMAGGAIMGGEITVAGAIEVAKLGSPAEVVTTLVLGRVPAMEEKAAQLEKLARQLGERRGALTAALAELEGQGSNLTVGEKEKIAGRQHEVATINEKIEQVLGVHKKLVAGIEDRRKVDLTVAKMIYPGTRLTIQEYVYRFVEELNGPVKIGRDRRGRGVYPPAGSSDRRALSEVADVHSE